MARKKTEQGKSAKPGKREINAELKKAKAYAKRTAKNLGIIVELWHSKDKPLEFSLNKGDRVKFLDEKYNLIALYNEKGQEVT